MSKGYYPQLTWLRGIAALLVVISHTVRSTETPYASFDTKASVGIFNALDLGSMAVTLFFALSGATLYLNHNNDNTIKDLLIFISKRFFRIYPTFIFSLFLYIMFNGFILSLYGPPKGVWMDIITVPYSYSGVAKHLLLYFDLSGNPFIINGAYWSLPVEFRYYLLFPIASLLLRYTGVISLMMMALCLSCLTFILPIKPSIPHFFILAPSFFGGMIAAYYYTKRECHKSENYWVVIAALFAVASFAWVYRQHLPAIPVLSQNYNWNIMVSVSIVYFSLKVNVSDKLKSIKRSLNFFGEISYSMYLLHQLALTTAFLIVVKLNITGNNKLYTIFPITITLTIFISCISFLFIERKGVSLGRKLLDRIG